MLLYLKPLRHQLANKDLAARMALLVHLVEESREFNLRLLLCVAGLLKETPLPGQGAVPAETTARYFPRCSSMCPRCPDCRAIGTTLEDRCSPKVLRNMSIAAYPQVTRGAPGRIRTCDQRIRSPTLYPAELRAPCLGAETPWQDQSLSDRGLFTLVGSRARPQRASLSGRRRAWRPGVPEMGSGYRSRAGVGW